MWDSARGIAKPSRYIWKRSSKRAELLDRMTVVTRFAPSPTGYLHIGGARTALFNWLYAKAKGGKFLLRIEDTDKERSTTEAVNAILDGLNWLGITPDEDPFYRSERADRHVEVANAMVEKGLAFRCYVTPEELSERRDQGEEGAWRVPSDNLG